MGERRWALGLVAVATLVALGGTMLARRTEASPLIRTVTVGAAPAGLVADERAGRAFVANENSNTVSVLDTRAGTLVRTVDVGFGPHALAVDERLGRVFVENVAGLSLSILDAGSGRPVHTTVFKATPVIMALDQRAARVLVAKADLTVDVLDARNGHLLATVPAPVTPAQNLDPVGIDEQSGHVLLVGDGQGGAMEGTVTTLDAASGRVVRTTTVGVATTDIAVDGRTGRAFVANNNSISVLATRSGALLRTVTLAPRAGTPVIDGAPVVDVATGRVFVATYNPGVNRSAILVLDAVTGRVTGTAAIGARPETMAVDAGTARVFVIGYAGVSVLDARSGALLRQDSADWLPWFGNVSPSAMVAVDASSGHVFVIRDGPTDSTGAYTDVGHVSVLDGHTGAVVRVIPVGVAPSMITVDSRARRVLVLNAGGALRLADPWGWMPSWLRHVLPFVPRPASHVQDVPASVSVLNARG